MRVKPQIGRRVILFPILHPHRATKDIGNILTKHMGNTFSIGMVWTYGTTVQGSLMRMQQPQGYGTEGYQPSILLFGDAHRLTYQGLGDED